MPDDQETRLTEQRETPAPEDDDEDDAPLPEIEGGSEGWKEVVKKERDERRQVRRELNALKREKAEREAAVKREQDAALAEQGKWKELAEQREKRVGELEPLAEQVKELTAVLEGYVQREREGLPAHVLEALDEMPLTKQLAFLSKHREAIKAGGTNGAPKYGGGGTNGTPPRESQVQQAVEELRKVHRGF